MLRKTYKLWELETLPTSCMINVLVLPTHHMLSDVLKKGDETVSRVEAAFVSNIACLSSTGMNNIVRDKKLRRERRGGGKEVGIF